MGSEGELTPLLRIASKQPARGQQFLVAFCGSLVAMIVGSTDALPSSLIPQLIEEGLAKNLEEAAILGTVYLVTAGPTSLIGGILGDWLGRRRTLLLCCPILLAGYISLPLAPTLIWILPSRILSALGSWLAFPLSGILIAEFAHPSLRGTLCSLPSVFMGLGELITYLLGALLPWRLMSWLLLFQPLLLLLLVLLIPESPQWLALQGQEEKARTSLNWVRGTSWNCEPELEEMLSCERSPDILDRLAILRSRPFLRSLAVTSSLFFLCQFTGIATLVAFMAPVLADSGLTFSPLAASVIIGSVRVATACISSFLLKNANRKGMFSSCSFILSLCSAALAAFSHWRTDLLAISPALGPRLLSSYNCQHNVLLPRLWHQPCDASHKERDVPRQCQVGLALTSSSLLFSFLFPIRSLGSSLVLTIAVISAAINAGLYPVLLRLTSFSVVFTIYSGATFVMFLLAVRIIPDHRGLTLTTIEQMNEREENLQ